MKTPKEPKEIISLSLISLIIVILTTLYEFFSSINTPYFSLLLGFLGSFFCIWMIRSSTLDYKLKLKIADRCTKKDFADIEFIGLEMKQGSGTSNTAFMILNFKGNKQRFTCLTDKIRIHYDKKKQFPIFYNPLNQAEFVYDNIEFKDTED
jgi:hypothetical protein